MQLSLTNEEPEAVRPAACFRCGSRVACRHRYVADVQLPFLDDHDGRCNNGNPWGAHGNPAGKARARMLALMNAQKAANKSVEG